MLHCGAQWHGLLLNAIIKERLHHMLQHVVQSFFDNARIGIAQAMPILASNSVTKEDFRHVRSQSQTTLLSALISTTFKRPYTRNKLKSKAVLVCITINVIKEYAMPFIAIFGINWC